MDNAHKDSRERVHEIKVGSVVLEIYKKEDSRNGKTYFDYRTAREFFVGDDEVGRGPYCQQRDMRDNIMAVVKAMEWVADQHRSMRDECLD